MLGRVCVPSANTSRSTTPFAPTRISGQSSAVLSSRKRSATCALPTCGSSRHTHTFKRDRALTMVRHVQRARSEGCASLPRRPRQSYRTLVPPWIHRLTPFLSRPPSECRGCPLNRRQAFGCGAGGSRCGHAEVGRQQGCMGECAATTAHQHSEGDSRTTAGSGNITGHLAECFMLLLLSSLMPACLPA